MPLNGFNLIRAKRRTSHETERSLSKFLEPSHRPKVVYTGNSMEFWRAGEDLSWNHRTSTPHRSETNGIAERAVRRVTEGTSAASLQNGLDERWSDSVACYCYLRNVQDLLADVKTPYERRFVEPKGQQYLLKQLLNIIRFRRETRQGSTNLARTYYQESFLAMSWSRGKLERGYSDSRSGRFGKVGSVRNLSSMNQRERSMDKDKQMMNSHFPVADEQNCQGETTNSKNPLLREPTVRREDLSRELQGESGESQPEMTLKPLPIFGRYKVTSSIVITMNLEFNSTCRRKKHSPTPLRYIDVTRSTHTDLDVLQEKQIDDYWNVDSNRPLSDSWKEFTKFTLLKENPPKGCLWSGRRLTKVHATSRSDHVWPEF